MRVAGGKGNKKVINIFGQRSLILKKINDRSWPGIARKKSILSPQRKLKLRH